MHARAAATGPFARGGANAHVASANAMRNGAETRVNVLDRAGDVQHSMAPSAQEGYVTLRLFLKSLGAS